MTSLLPAAVRAEHRPIICFTVLAAAAALAIAAAIHHQSPLVLLTGVASAGAGGLAIAIWMRKEGGWQDLQARAETADRANLAKSQFLARMSHELRTPLNAIIGFAEVLEVNTGKRLSDSEAEYAACIRKAGGQLHRLIDDVLDLARIEAGRLEFAAVPVSVPELFQDVEGVFHAAAPRAGITLSFHQPREPLQASADETRVKQVLTNLVSNAIKYNRPGGRVEVRAMVAREGVVRIEVEDDGLGIPAGHSTNVFEPFNRLGREFSKVEGSGIGLALARLLVEGMKGQIGFSSEPGRGTLFWIELPSSLPCGSCDTSARPTLQMAGERAQVDTVLYIEDVASNVEVVRTILSYRPAIRLIDAPDAVRGIEAAKAEKPALILLDIQLPGVNGLDAIRLLRSCPQVADAPIIALTALAMPDDRERAREAGFDGYLTKPIEPAEFVDCIDAALAGARRRAGQLADAH